MKTSIAQTRNIRELLILFQYLDGRNPQVPGIGLLIGEAGIGKTTAVTYLKNYVNPAVVTASSLWTPYQMLCDIARELGEVPSGGAAALQNSLVEKFRVTKRGLVLDECEERLFLTGRKYVQMVDILRDLHDRANMPLIFVGYQKMLGTVSRFPQLEGRVSRSLEFQRLDVADTELFVQALHPTLILSKSFLELLHRRTDGRPRQTVTSLEAIAEVAKVEGWGEVTPALWGDRVLFQGDRG